MLRFVVRISLASLLAAYSLAAHASGFALREWSASAQGNGFAGATAGAEDVSYISFNPAGLTRHDGDHAAVTFTYIMPQSEFSSSGATTILPSPIGGGNGGSDVAPDALAPALYLTHQFSSKLYGGISVFAPYGLTTDYDDDWIGRYHAIKTEILGIEINPILAYKVTPKLSVGGGLRIMYARGVMSNAVDFGTLALILDPDENVFGGTPAGNDGFAEIEGDDFGFGFNVGLLYEIDKGTRVGASYRSVIRTSLEGDAKFKNGAVGDAIGGFLGAFSDTGIKTNIDFPETASVGVYHELSPRWAVMAEATWTRWSRIKELRIMFDNPAQPDEVVPSNWEDTWFFSIGATYRHSPRLTARFGLAYDQSPVPDSTRTPRVPDEDRAWVSVGLQYALGKTAVLDIGYTHMFVPDPKIDLSAAEPDNALRGNLAGSYDASADVFAVQLKYDF